MTTDTTTLRETVATACRVLAREGLVTGTLGHVSARTDEGRLVIRCRGPHERGLRRSTHEDVGTITFDGDPVDLAEGYRAPYESPIHTELMRQRPDVGAVVHAHPPAALLVGLAGLELRPVIGAYNIPAMRLALEGVPTYHRPVLISRRELANELVEVMGESNSCLMVGHGITVVGATVQQAVVSAINLNVLMEITVRLAQLGVTAPTLDSRDLLELPDLGSRFNDEFAWRSLVADLEAEDAAGAGPSC